jgi:hypothetical protein
MHMPTRSHTKMYGIRGGICIFFDSENALFANYRPIFTLTTFLDVFIYGKHFVLYMTSIP